METKDIITLSLSSIAIVVTLINLYKTFWQAPSPVVSIKRQFLAFTDIDNGNQVWYILFDGILLNRSKQPLVLKGVNLYVVHEGEWIALPWIYVNEDEGIDLNGKKFRFGPNADKYDLNTINSIITPETPQVFYAKFNLPEEIMNKILEQSVNFLFVIKDGFGRKFNYMISSNIEGGQDLSQPIKIYLKNSR